MHLERGPRSGPLSVPGSPGRNSEANLSTRGPASLDVRGRDGRTVEPRRQTDTTAGLAGPRLEELLVLPYVVALSRSPRRMCASLELRFHVASSPQLEIELSETRASVAREGPSRELLE